MSDHPEQKSVSDSTPAPPDKYPVLVKALPQPFRVVIAVPSDDLKEEFDNYYTKNENQLLQKFPVLVKGKKVKGGRMRGTQKRMEDNTGITNLYSGILTDLVIDHTENLLFIDGVDLQGYEPGSTAQLVAVCYYYPDLEFEGELDYHCEEPVKRTLEEAWEDRKIELSYKYETFEDLSEDTVLAEDQQVLVDLIASKDGEPYADGTFRRKWISLSMLPPVLKDSLLAHKVGDLYELSYAMPDLAGGGEINIDSHVKIYGVRMQIPAEVADDIAKKEGFDTLDQLRDQFDVEFGEYVERARHSTALSHLVDQIIRNSIIPEFPAAWLQINIENRVKDHVANFDGDIERAMVQIGAKSEEEMVQRFKGSLFRETLQTLAVRYFAKAEGMSFGDPQLKVVLAEKMVWVPRTKEEKTDG